MRRIVACQWRMQSILVPGVHTGSEVTPPCTCLHRALMLRPFCLYGMQVSIMSIFEYYRMAIPMFAPSVDLLTEWVLKHR